MSTTTPCKPPFIDHEIIYDRLMLFGTVVGLMADHPESFGSTEHYALQTLLYETAKTVWPDREEDRKNTL